MKYNVHYLNYHPTGKQLCCLKDFLLPKNFSCFKGGCDRYTQNQRKPAQVIKGSGSKLSEVAKDCEWFSDQTHTRGVFIGSYGDCFNNEYKKTISFSNGQPVS